MGDDDAVIKQGIKKPEKNQDDSHLGVRPSYGPFFVVDPTDRKPLYLAEFEGWGIELECRVW